MITKNLGDRIKELRQKTGLSQEKFALKIEMDRTYFASVEAGRRNIAIVNIKKIADGLGMGIWLYDEYNWPSGNCCGQVTDGHGEYYPHAVTFEKAGGTVEIRVVQNRIARCRAAGVPVTNYGICIAACHGIRVTPETCMVRLNG